jgi:hypothetical protein
MTLVPASARPFACAIVCAVIGLCGLAVPASAQRVDLSLSATSIAFPSADPDTTPSIAAPVMQVTYRIRQNASDADWQITVLASGDLSSGLATIPVSNITWSATPSPPFQSGTMSAITAQRVAGGFGNVNPSRTGYLSFFLANSWSYDVGTYSAVFTFTLTAP